MELNNDILGEVLNYCYIDDIYKVKFVSKYYNYFIDNNFVLIYYNYHRLMKHIIIKHCVSIEHIVHNEKNFEYNYSRINFDLSDSELSKLVNIKTLILPFDNNISDVGLIHCKKIESLDLLHNTNITDGGFKYASNIKLLKMYSNNNITDEGLSNMPNIKILHLEHNTHITSKGLQYIPKIESLVLYSNNNITDEEYKKYIPNCKNLKHNDIMNVVD